jgi:hypothetical protein
MNVCELILILIIVVACVIFYYASQQNKNLSIIGAGLAGSTLFKQNDFTQKRIYIPDNSKIVVDGHNMIHSYTEGKQLDINQFEKVIKDISKILLKAFKKHKIHIVLKNPPTKILSKYEKHKKKELTRRRTIETRIPYFQGLVDISKQFPDITYHLAYGKTSKKADKKNNHHLKGRDDYLTVYLGKDAYIISKDRYRDFKQFGAITSFNHYSVKNGVTRSPERIKPLTHYHKLTKPTIGNHFMFKFKSKNEMGDLKNGTIILDKTGQHANIYIQK